MPQSNETESQQIAHHLVLAHYHPPQGNQQRVVDLLAELAAASRAEEGNTAYDFYVSGSTPGEILIVERYVSADAFAEHRSSDHFRSIGWEQIIPLLEDRRIEEFDI